MNILIHIFSTLLGISTMVLLLIIVWLDEIERKAKESEDNSDEQKKQIEEMAKTLCEDYGKCKNCNLANPECENPCLVGDDCERLYNQGYRKASEVALEVIKKAEQILNVKIIGIEEDFFYNTAAHWDAIRKECYEEILVELAELKKKYTEER